MGDDYGLGSREPVFSGSRRIPNLYQRRLADGGLVFEARLFRNGRARRYRLEASTKTDAIHELKALEVDLDRGETGRSPALALTVDEVAGDWFAHLDARTMHRDPRQRRSARTVAMYRQRYEKHIEPELGRRPANEVTVRDVRRLIDRASATKTRSGKTLAPGTITSIVNILSGILQFGIKAGQVDRNPVRDLDRDDRPGAARTTEPRYLTPAELELLFSKLTDTFRPVALVCALAGLRISEALGLHWRDVDFKTGEIHVREQLGAHGDLVPVKTTASAAPAILLPELARELRAHHARQRERGFDRVHADALVFTTSRGRPQSRRNALRAVYKAGDDAKLNTAGREKIGLHDLRHSLVGNALAAGVTLPEAAVLARHADARVTAVVYAGVADETRAAIAGKLTDAGIGT